MPNGEESVGRDLFLARLGFNRERHAQLQEAEDREEKHYWETKLLQHEITEAYTDCCETWLCCKIDAVLFVYGDKLMGDLDLLPW